MRDLTPDTWPVVAGGECAVKDACQGVIVASGDRIELMIMAAGTRYCLPKEGATYLVDLMINNVRGQLPLNIILQRPGADR